MKPLFGSALFLLFVQCCEQPNNRIPADARLVAKYQVLDEIISPHHVKCAGITQEFLKASPYTCSFTVQELEFNVEYKYVVDTEGYLKEFQPYLAEGPVSHTIAELRKDTAYLKYERLNDFHLAFSPARMSILDGKRVVIIERIFPAEKLILARKDAYTPKGRRFLYQYQ
ncbi:MAG: hypothetical protein ACRYF0_20055 [Janthinobacterium lividum]